MPEVKATKAHQRRLLVEECLLNGLTESQIHTISRTEKHNIMFETIQKDIKEIHTKWLLHDTQWFTRAHVSRIIAVKRLSAQYSRIERHLAEAHHTLTPGDVVQIERSLTNLTLRIHELESLIDPDMYLQNLETSTTQSNIYERQTDEQRLAGSMSPIPHEDADGAN